MNPTNKRRATGTQTKRASASFRKRFRGTLDSGVDAMVNLRRAYSSDTGPAIVNRTICAAAFAINLNVGQTFLSAGSGFPSTLGITGRFWSAATKLAQSPLLVMKQARSGWTEALRHANAKAVNRSALPRTPKRWRAQSRFTSPMRFRMKRRLSMKWVGTRSTASETSDEKNWTRWNASLPRG